MEEIYLTEEGFQEKVKRLEYLKTEKTQDVIEKLKTARDFGDLSENAEYDMAREEQAKVEAEIELLEKTLANAKIVKAGGLHGDKISVGNKIKLYDEEFDEEVEYSIVGSLESDPSHGLVSNESPIGKALLGKKVGDKVEFETPAGVVKMKVLAIL